MVLRKAAASSVSRLHLRRVVGDLEETVQLGRQARAGARLGEGLVVGEPAEMGALVDEHIDRPGDL